MGQLKPTSRFDIFFCCVEDPLLSLFVVALWIDCCPLDIFPVSILYSIGIDIDEHYKVWWIQKIPCGSKQNWYEKKIANKHFNIFLAIFATSISSVNIYIAVYLFRYVLFIFRTFCNFYNCSVFINFYFPTLFKQSRVRKLKRQNFRRL